MRQWMVGIGVAGMCLAAATPTLAQARPDVSGSESSRRIEATCSVNGEETPCGGEHAGGMEPFVPGPIIVGISPVVIPVVVPGLGAGSGGHAGTDTEVDRSRHHGREIAR